MKNLLFILILFKKETFWTAENILVYKIYSSSIQIYEVGWVRNICMEYKKRKRIRDAARLHTLGQFNLIKYSKPLI